MPSFVPVSLVATAALFSAVQGIDIIGPASGDTVYASEGFDVVWTYDSSDFTNWEIELANPDPGALLATDIIQPTIASGVTSTTTYHVAAFTGVADGTNYQVVLDPRGGGVAGSALPESGEFTIVNSASGTTTGTTTATSTSPSSTGTSTGTSTATATGSTTISSSGTTSATGSITVVPPISVSTGASNSTIVSASTSFSTFISGTVSTVIPQSTVYKTTVVGGATSTGASGTGSATSTPTIALAAGGQVVSSVGLVSGIIGAIMGVLML